MRRMAQVTELGGHVLGGKYRLVRPVSEGPRQVWEARHERLAGRFAIKTWPATTPWDAFRRGAELALTLRHPGVLQVIDFNCEPGASPFLVLEWIDGARLSDVIVESGILPIERVAPIIESAAWALASAHQQGVVHQELRPDEVFVVHAPGTMREWVKLAGFGVSAALARAGSAPPSRYRAPEQKSAALVDDDGEGDDPQSDQYSLAAIAYEMLAGVPPFRDAGERDDAEPSRAEPLPISELAPGVSAAVDAAIRQGLAREPEQRFAGVLEFARALRDAVDGASPEALRRRSAASVSPERRARPAEAVSPFFNPLQGRAGEVIRRVVSSTARLRTLGSRPGRPAARIALAGVTLILAIAVTALALRGRPPGGVEPRAAVASAPSATAPTASAPAPNAPAAAAAPAPDEPVQVQVPAMLIAADDTEAPAGGDEAAAPDAAPAKRASTAAWARLGGAAKTTKPRTIVAAAKPAAAVKPAAKPAAVKPASAKTPAAALAKLAAAPAKPVGAEGGACVMSVGSRPPADVWLDDRSLGRRTPLVKFRTACGDHKLALKRTDLDLYQMEIVTLRAGTPFKKVYPLQ
jgi:serine/threonine-protein kinase